MRCKCGARSVHDHKLRIRRGEVAAHVYNGPYWAPKDAQKEGVR